MHELARQWFGDSVSVQRWKDIWLNEGFATYAEWLWSEHTGGPTTQQNFDELYASPRVGRPVVLPRWPIREAAQFTALATALSGRNLTALFSTWLYTSGKPVTA